MKRIFYSLLLCAVSNSLHTNRFFSPACLRKTGAEEWPHHLPDGAARGAADQRVGLSFRQALFTTVPTKPGLATLTAKALLHGTKTKTKSGLEEELDFIGASVNTYASKEASGLSAKFAAKDRDKVLSIISELLQAPTFPTVEFEKEKKLVLAALEQAKESPRNVIGEYYDQLLYGNHVYANPENGRSNTVARLSATDAKRFYQRNYIPNGSAIAVVGDFSTGEMKSRLGKLFEGWAKGTVPANTASAPVAPVSEARVVLVNKNDARETTFYIGGPGVPRNNPDYVAMEVVNTLFGGRFTSWLNDELRVNTGLTYGAGSNFSRLKNAGTFAISTFTATKNTKRPLTRHWR
jgi:predicted Zn-dependent peptidase